ncbi:S8 family peptidase [Pseudomarimonas salicorniae]|uniref:S8 family serine peptidase n=1 Tax=Pseudomarimonas salicorniae TaxID=2933270 RepID=A0ABT0GJZ4_9GAMM|nr:S8 family peptidase [Lysobacter sp. CAU 1642]MCK7594875.1 S8 family serine peptidase [Lysobacter sp. CAU 1642]
MRHALVPLTLAISAALAASAAQAGGRSDLVLAALQAGRAHTGELLVQFKPGAGEADLRAVTQGLGASRAALVRDAGKGRLELLRLPAGLAIADAVRAVSGDAAVEFAEPNWTYQHAATSNDTYVTNGSLWGMTGTFGSQAANAWSENKQNCSGVLVGVIDEGIYHQHEDLAANMWVNPFDPIDGIDNDGNGYVDDARGWDFDGGSNDINSGGANDDHGTHVAGTIAGVGGNGKGVAGVCWSGVKMISAKFLGRRGGSTAAAIQAVDYITDLKTRHGLNIIATNNSWGGGGYSQALKDAIDRANQAGVLFIAAAGNSAYDNDATASYPSNYDSANVIAVASITSTGGLSSFSQWGATTVDIGAPGSGIWSTVPKSSKGKLISGYASYNGTSMATPHVTGAAALYKALNPTASAAQVKAAILNTATPTPSLQGKVLTGGRLDVSTF